MERKRSTLRIAAILLALVMVSAIGLAGTLARYTAEFEGASATVRAGVFRVTPGAFSTAFTLGAANAIFNADGTTANPNVVATGGIIVPGSVIRSSAGTFTVNNQSEVAVNVFMAGVELTNDILTGDNVEFRVGPAPADWGDIASVLNHAQFDGTTALNGATPIPAATTSGAIALPVIYVRWVNTYATGSDDTSSTPYGMAAACDVLGCICDYDDVPGDDCQYERDHEIEFTFLLRAEQVIA